MNGGLIGLIKPLDGKDKMKPRHKQYPCNTREAMRQYAAKLADKTDDRIRLVRYQQSTLHQSVWFIMKG